MIEQVANRDFVGYMQVVCKDDEHDYIEVTTTTYSDDGINTHVTKSSCYQCSKCGRLMPPPISDTDE